MQEAQDPRLERGRPVADMRHIGAALQGNPSRTGGIPKPQGILPVLVGFLSPSLVGALCARDYWGGRGVHTGASRCVRGPD